MRTIVVLAMLIACAGHLARAQSPPAPTAPSFKASVDVVPISAVVRDRRGRLVTSLTAADFEIFDKGKPSRIVDFQIDQTSSLTMAVLVDVSGSMQIGPKMALAREVLELLGEGLTQRRDNVGVFTFDAELRERQPFGTSPTDLDEVLEAAEPFGTTSLYDAIAQTAQQLGRRASERRAIVVLTDGVDTSSAFTAGEVSGLASSIDVPVYVIVTAAPIDREAFMRETLDPSRTSADLRDPAEWTGGSLLWVSAPEEAVRQTGQLFAELRHQYLIAIETATAREWRPIAVRVRNDRLTVRARSGYFSRDRM